MEVISKIEFDQKERSLIKLLKKNVFIYPTDSIYGIGCDATNKDLVSRVRELKNSTLQPFSIIVPSKKWVYDNCEVSDKAKSWVENLGSSVNIEGENREFSLILKLKNKNAIAPNVTQGLDSISVRIPNHWFASVVEKMNIPIITTSANPTGGDFMTNIDDLHPQIKQGVSHCIYEGPIKGRPSTLVFLDEKDVSFQSR